jgi:hypothetical protein
MGKVRSLGSVPAIALAIMRKTEHPLKSGYEA